MVTGDNMLTAIAISKALGLGTNAINGQDLEALDDEELRKIVEEKEIFARVTPVHKLKILKALQANGHRVAMTGDGINDAPALKGADVGVSMGIRGTEVAREASDMVILDDNFKTIVAAVKEGRTIFDNIRKFVTFLLSCNFAEVFVVFIASLFGYLPITAIQILWINLITDGAPALALGVDPPNLDIMERPPRKKGEGVINKKIAFSITSIGITLTLFILLIYFASLKLYGFEIARTMAFTSFVLFELVIVAAIRKREKLGFFSNKYLWIALLISIALQFLIIYTPLAKLFGAVQLGVKQISILIISLFFVYLISITLAKFGK